MSNRAVSNLVDEWRARANLGWETAKLSPDEIDLFRLCTDELETAIDKEDEEDVPA